MLLFATSPTLIEASTFACKCENIPPSLKNELMYFLNQQEKTEVNFFFNFKIRLKYVCSNYYDEKINFLNLTI